MKGRRNCLIRLGVFNNFINFLIAQAIVKEENSLKELATIKAEYTREQLVVNRYREKCEKLEKAYQKQEEIFCEWNAIVFNNLNNDQVR